MEMIIWFIAVAAAAFIGGFFCGVRVFHEMLIAPAIRERVLRDGDDVYTLTKRRKE